MEPSSFAGAPKWMKRRGTGGRRGQETNRISQPNVQYNSGRGQSQVGLIYERSGYSFGALLGEGRVICFPSSRVSMRRKKQSEK